MSPTSRISLLVEAGERGWESLEFKELLSSAQELLGFENVGVVVYRPGQGITSHLDFLRRLQSATHFLYDPRTGSQAPFRSYARAVFLALTLRLFRLVPVVLLTDYCSRTLRIRARIVAGLKGRIATFLRPPKTHRLIRSKIVGPLPLAISLKTAHSFKDSNIFSTRDHGIVFSGSLYEPRRSLLSQVANYLEMEGLPTLNLVTREPGQPRITDEEYWQTLSEADIVINTTTQSSEAELDCAEMRQLNYRFMEALVAGALLVSEIADDAEDYFIPGVHYLAFRTVEEACSQISWALRNPNKAATIAKRGQLRARELAVRHKFLRELLY